MNIESFVHQLFPVFEQFCWQADTSETPDVWTSSNPAMGQSAVTALVLQDLWGGDILRATVRDTTHYWNLISRLPLLEVDMTRVEFSDFHGPIPNPEVIGREQVLSSPETIQRYELFKSRVSQHVHVG